MADPDRLAAEFAAELEAGRSPDPNDWLARVSGEERQKLEELIDRYLMTAPRRAWDPVAYESSLAKVAVERVYESLEGVSGTWPELLPRLRNRARVKRADLVRRLAEALGVGTGEAQLEKVAAYYHRMEHGLLEAEGVSGRVIEALAGIVDASADAIRAAGAQTDAGGGGAGPVAFARVTSLNAELPIADEGAAGAAPASSGPPSPRDEIDELFTGG